LKRGEEIDQVTLSVIVPTRNRCDALSRTISTLFEQTATDFEIVVSDNGSTDETAKTLQNLKARSPVPFRCLSEDKPGPAAARNSAVAASTGQILLLLGDDTEPTDRNEDLGRIEEEFRRYASAHVRECS
jgi:glycosyltransferase involved in cell wall biosynthesis